MGIELRIKGYLLAGAAIASFAPVGVVAQDAATLCTSAQLAVLATCGTVFTPADFDRFAPRNALDMLQQVPGFSIRDDNGDRGLGQASANVLVNGERISSKSDGIFDQLRRISTSRVERIEILDGAALGIPGLSGQVANVVTKPSPIGGRFEYRATARPKYAKPSYFGGEVSLSGSSDDFEWTVAYTHGVGRGAAGGGTAYITDGMGNITENRDVLLRFVGDFPQLSGNAKWTSSGGTVINANASYSRRYTDFSDDEYRDIATDVNLLRDFDNRNRGWGYEFGGDADFALGPGRLKLIGLERYDRQRQRAQSVLAYDDGRPDEGNRFTTRTETGERIIRGEYRWDMLGGNWQLDAEATYNRLERTSSLFDLDPAGDYVEIAFPNGTGGVTEDRYEAILTYNRTLADGLSLQVGGGGEYSTLKQTGPGGLTREFWRPKGSVSLSWTAMDDLDISLKFSRDVGQLSFGDFLASVSLQQNQANAGNAQLVPPQSWDLDLEVKKDLGGWGSTTLRVLYVWYQDRIELIPLPGGLETRGNIPSATYRQYDWRSTFELSEIGFNGAKLDTTFVYRDTDLEDPLTGISRPFSGQTDISANAELRHDIPGTDWAWGAGFDYNHTLPYYRLAEVGRDYEGPTYTYAFIEHKDVLGMTLNFQVFNLTDGRALLDRTVYDGPRDSSPVLFTEHRDLSVQPIFRLQLSGDF